MMMFWIFLVVDLVTVGIFYGVYGGKKKYTEYEQGMLLGVHLPRSAAESSEVRELLERWRKRSDRFYLWNLAACILISFLNFWYVSFFMIAWTVWLLELCAGALGILCVAHRKLYDLKVERGWIGSSGSRILAADTRTTALSGKMGASPWWHLVCLALILMPCLLPGVRKFMAETSGGWIYLGCGAMVSAVFCALQAIYLRIGNKVYSEDPAVNFRVNRMQKNAWSWALLGGDAVNVAACLMAASFMDGEQWGGSGVTAGYVILESIPPVFLIAAFVFVARRKRALLEADEKPVTIDDDVYWKNGWYSNPNDKRLVVQDWMCSWNYSSNMAHPASKVILAIGLSFLVIGLPVLCVVMLRLDFTPIELTLGREGLAVTSGYSDVELDYDEILDVRLLDELPEDRYTRTNGSADGRVLIGKFRGRETGKCRMYLYVDYGPLLEIGTEDGPVYVNSRTPGEAETWYETICERTGL